MMRPVHLVVIGALFGFAGCFAPSHEPHGEVREPKEQDLPASAKSQLQGANEEIRQGRFANAESLLQQVLQIRNNGSVTFDTGLDTDLLARISHRVQGWRGFSAGWVRHEQAGAAVGV